MAKMMEDIFRKMGDGLVIAANGLPKTIDEKKKKRKSLLAKITLMFKTYFK
jgi:hypothetical protein|tara:strand:+ start:2755 stop:2907 length:153 start_codon:yes stop_codon:yes gene_type:complete